MYAKLAKTSCILLPCYTCSSVFYRTIRHIWILCWLWRTGELPNPYSTLWGYSTSIIRVILMPSISTTSLGWVTHTKLYSIWMEVKTILFFFREENVAGLFALNTGLDLYTTVTVVSWISQEHTLFFPKCCVTLWSSKIGVVFTICSASVILEMIAMRCLVYLIRRWHWCIFCFVVPTHHFTSSPWIRAAIFLLRLI